MEKKMEQPSYLVTKLVDFRESIEETLKSTFESRISHTLELGLCKDLCYFLLNHVLSLLDVHRYQSFSEMLQAEDLAKVLPGIKTIDEGVLVYKTFYTEEKEKTNGVLAICVATLAAQPFICFTGILSRVALYSCAVIISYIILGEGVQCYLESDHPVLQHLIQGLGYVGLQSLLGLTDYHATASEQLVVGSNLSQM